MTPIPEHSAVTIHGRTIHASEFSEANYLNIYTALWQNMERENALINHRISWALVLTAGLITGQAFIAGGIIQAGREPDVRMLQCVACFFMALMSGGATRICHSVREAVEAAINQLAYLKDFYHLCAVGDRNLFECYLALPRPFGDPDAHKRGNAASSGIAPALYQLWMVLTITEFVAGVLFLAIH